MYKAKNDCFFSLSAVHSQPCVFNNTTKSTMLQSGGVGAPGSTTDALFVIRSPSFLHTHSYSFSHTRTHTYVYAIHTTYDLITAFVTICTKMASATGNRLLIHTAVFSTFQQNDANVLQITLQFWDKIIRTIVIDNWLLPAKLKMYIYKETSAQSAMHTVTSKGTCS